MTAHSQIAVQRLFDCELEAAQVDADSACVQAMRLVDLNVPNRKHLLQQVHDQANAISQLRGIDDQPIQTLSAIRTILS